MAFTVNVTYRNGVATTDILSVKDLDLIGPIKPTTANTASSAATFSVLNGDGTVDTIITSETYTQVMNALTSDRVLSGAETTTNKATTFGTVNDTLYPSTEAVVENFAGRHYYVASGTDTYTATLVPATTPFAGMEAKLKFGITNTGAATFNAAAIKKGTAGTTALSASDLVITKIYTLIFDGTNWQINL
jgi:hypothetical protein